MAAVLELWLLIRHESIEPVIPDSMFENQHFSLPAMQMSGAAGIISFLFIWYGAYGDI